MSKELSKQLSKFSQEGKAYPKVNNSSNSKTYFLSLINN